MGSNFSNEYCLEDNFLTNRNYFKKASDLSRHKNNLANDADGNLYLDWLIEINLEINSAPMTKRG